MKTYSTALAVFLCTLVVASGTAGDTVYLSTLDLGKIRQGWGKPQADKSVTGTPLSIAGHKFEHGIGTHAASVMYIDLKGGAERFCAQVGVDDNAKDPRGSIFFRVIGDEKLLWKSEVLKTGAPAAAIDVPLKGVKLLILVAGPTDDGLNFDHADWADARIEGAAPKPEIVNPPSGEAVILTPKPGPEPRINGPTIYGARRGSPFLFTIPATGERPVQFFADGLPAGLSLDSATGIIAGALQARGEFPVKLRARNARGEAARVFKIVAGDTLALTPPMGWNSWYVLETRVTDHDMRAAADAMVSTGMINHGYMYVNIDDCWMVKPGATEPDLGGPTRDPAGRLLCNKRFPDMHALTDYIHAKGLKAGIYISPGPKTCGGYEGSYQHEESDARTFAEWGFDFLKYDWCSYDKIAKDHSRDELKKPYAQMSALLRQQKRDIVFNLCQYGMGNVWEWGAEVGGHCWRTEDDLGGSFEGIPAALYRMGFKQNGLEPYAGPGHWNDPDYLLLGQLSNWNGGTAPTPLSPNEQYTHVSLWCLLAAPLIFSGDITRVDEFTLSLLTNDEVLEIDQDALGRQGRRVAKVDDTQVWAKELADGSRAVGLFNLDEIPQRITVNWADAGLKGSVRVRDLWRQKDLGVHADGFSASVPSHGVLLLRVWPK
jgi:alpha-galactosidase